MNAIAPAHWQTDGIEDDDELMKDYMKEFGGSSGESSGRGAQRPDLGLVVLLVRESSIRHDSCDACFSRPFGCLSLKRCDNDPKRRK